MALRLVLLAFYAVAIGVAVYLIATRKRRALRDIGLQLGVAVVLITIFLALSFFSEDVKEGVTRLVLPTITGGVLGGGSTGETSPAATGVILLTVVGVVIVAGAITFLTTALMAARSLTKRKGERRARAARVVNEAIRDMLRGDDPRSAVIRCYDQMSLIVMKRGVRGFRTLTPQEFAARVRESLHVSGEYIDELTALFEEARYSHHPIGEPQRRRALETLRAFRSDLQGGGSR